MYDMERMVRGWIRNRIIKAYFPVKFGEKQEFTWVRLLSVFSRANYPSLKRFILMLLILLQ